MHGEPQRVVRKEISWHHRQQRQEILKATRICDQTKTEHSAWIRREELQCTTNSSITLVLADETPTAVQF